jgi:hypothetical protein
MAPLSPEQQRLSDAMISYWTQFATTGDPNSPDQPIWSPDSTRAEEFQSLVLPTSSLTLVISTPRFGHVLTSTLAIRVSKSLHGEII